MMGQIWQKHSQLKSSNSVLIENSNPKISATSFTLKTLPIHSLYLTNPFALHPHVSYRYIVHDYIFCPPLFSSHSFIKEKYSLKPNVHLWSLVWNIYIWSVMLLYSLLIATFMNGYWHTHCSGSDVIKEASPSMQLPRMILAEVWRWGCL